MPSVRKPLKSVIYPSPDDVRRYDALGLFAPETMGEAFSRVAKRFPGRVALSDVHASQTFAEIDDLTDLIACGLLDLGLQPLDRAIFQIANSRELVISLIACLKAGVIPVCTLTAHRRAEIGYLARHSGAKAHFICCDDPKFDFANFAREMRIEAPSLKHTIVARGTVPDDADFVGLLALARGKNGEAARTRLAQLDRDPAQVAVFQLSGGTSGVPKIIPRFHNEYLYQIKTAGDWQGLTEETVAFSPAPMMHNAPIIAYWGSVLWRGGEVVCALSLDTRAIAETIASRRPNWMSLPLPLAIKMQKDGTLNQAHFRGATLCTASNTRRLSELTGARVVPLYGMTEGIISFGRSDDPTFVIEITVGRPISPYDEFRIVDPDTGAELPDGTIGEFIFKGPSSIRGYYDAEERNREAFTPEQFCRSGDLMRVHLLERTRYLSFEGRVKDVVSRGGEKINCQEVERVLIKHPNIGAVAIVPMPDPVFGERMCAFVIPESKHSAPSVAELGRFLEAAGLAKFKWPERIEAVSEFPTTSSGKLSKPLLKQKIADILRAEETAMAKAI